MTPTPAGILAISSDLLIYLININNMEMNLYWKGDLQVLLEEITTKSEIPFAIYTEIYNFVFIIF
jgi:hypothetical protein